MAWLQSDIIFRCLCIASIIARSSLWKIESPGALCIKTLIWEKPSSLAYQAACACQSCSQLESKSWLILGAKTIRMYEGRKHDCNQIIRGGGKTLDTSSQLGTSPSLARRKLQNIHLCTILGHLHAIYC